MDAFTTPSPPPNQSKAQQSHPVPLSTPTVSKQTEAKDGVKCTKYVFENCFSFHQQALKNNPFLQNDSEKAMRKIQQGI